MQGEEGDDRGQEEEFHGTDDGPFEGRRCRQTVGEFRSVRRVRAGFRELESFCFEE